MKEKEQEFIEVRPIKEQKFKRKQNTIHDTFASYLINPIKNAFNTKISINQKQQLQKISSSINKSVQKRTKIMININQKTSMLQAQKVNNESLKDIMSFQSKDINHMLLTVYLMFLKNPQENLFHQLLNQNKQTQENHQNSKSAVNKLRIILQGSTECYLHKKVKQEHKLTLKQRTQPLLMSYIMNSNTIQINSKLILSLISTILANSSSEKLSEKMISIINQTLKSQNQTIKCQKIESNSYLVTFGLLTDEIIAIVPCSSNKQKHKTQTDIMYPNEYKLFLFPNCISLTQYLNSVQTIQQNVNPEDEQDSGSANRLSSESRGNNRDYKQQPNTIDNKRIFPKREDVQTFSRRQFVVLVFVVVVAGIVFLRATNMKMSLSHQDSLKYEQTKIFIDEINDITAPLIRQTYKQIMNYLKQKSSMIVIWYEQIVDIIVSNVGWVVDGGGIIESIRQNELGVFFFQVKNILIPLLNQQLQLFSLPKQMSIFFKELSNIIKPLLHQQSAEINKQLQTPLLFLSQAKHILIPLYQQFHQYIHLYINNQLSPIAQLSRTTIKIG